jgi:hypothetical protein
MLTHISEMEKYPQVGDLLYKRQLKLKLYLAKCHLMTKKFRDCVETLDSLMNLVGPQQIKEDPLTVKLVFEVLNKRVEANKALGNNSRAISDLSQLIELAQYMRTSTEQLCAYMAERNTLVR